MRLAGFFKCSVRSIVFACSICLVLALAACSTGSTSGSASTPTPTSQPASTPTVASSPTTSTSMTTYTGSGYTIDYPQGWKVNATGKSVVFTDSTGIYNFTIVVSPNPGGIASPDTIVNAGVQGVKGSLTNPQTVNVPASTTIGGDTWVQKSITGDSSTGGQTGTVQMVVASDNHPANSPSTNSFTVIYATLQATFDAANGQYFQPMLQSFKFTS